MDIPNRKLIALNRVLMTICSFLASTNKELNLPTKLWLAMIDKVSLLWSLVIIITEVVKFTQQSDRSAAFMRKRLLGRKNWAKENRNSAWRDLLLLDYLPRMDEFGKLYYGLFMVTITSGLVWRVYLNYYRQSSNYLKHHPSCSSSGRRLFDAKLELIEFYLNGPSDLAPGNNSQVQDQHKSLAPSSLEVKLDQDKDPDAARQIPRLAAPRCSRPQQPALAAQQRRVCVRASCAMSSVISAHKCAENLASKVHKPALYPVQLPKQENLLARTHGTQRLVGAFRRVETHAEQQIEQLIGGDVKNKQIMVNTLKQVYWVPIRSDDFLRDKSVARWKFLASHVLKIVLLVVLLSLPIFYYTIIGLNAVREKFRLEPRGNDGDALIVRALNFYGPLEQIYCCTQASMFFMATNILLSLFHADLLYKVMPIVREVRLLSHLYRVDQLSSIPHSEVYGQQLRIWAYFDNIAQMDAFVSKYSFISMAMFIIGLSFAQSYLKIEDPSLKAATEAALLSNILSFTFLHLVSFHIEKCSQPMHMAILSILARETHHEAKREWQRTLFGFFGPDARRTFTLGGRYPLNLQSFFKTIFGLATVSLVINRLFHKRAWEASFAHMDRMLAANETNGAMNVIGLISG